MRYLAKKELADQNWKSQLAKGYENIPAGAEIEYEGPMSNFYGNYAKVRYKGRLYYVKHKDIVRH